MDGAILLKMSNYKWIAKVRYLWEKLPALWNLNRTSIWLAIEIMLTFT